MPPRSAHAPTVQQPTAARAKRRHVATGQRPGPRNAVVLLIEAKIEGLAGLIGTVDFETARASADADVIAALELARVSRRMRAHDLDVLIACERALRDAEIAHAEHLLLVVIPVCEAGIADAERAYGSAA